MSKKTSMLEACGDLCDSVYVKAAAERDAGTEQSETAALKAECSLLKQVSGEVCDRCGWATVFPPDPCALCENEKLQAENTRLRQRAEKLQNSLQHHNDLVGKKRSSLVAKRIRQTKTLRQMDKRLASAKTENARLKAELAEWLDMAMRSGAWHIVEGKADGWWDSQAIPAVCAIGDRLVELGKWERNPYCVGSCRWLYRPLEVKP